MVALVFDTSKGKDMALAQEKLATGFVEGLTQTGKINPAPQRMSDTPHTYKFTGDQVPAQKAVYLRQGRGVCGFSPMVLLCKSLHPACSASLCVRSEKSFPFPRDNSEWKLSPSPCGL
jgi:hypothetical protein